MHICNAQGTSREAGHPEKVLNELSKQMLLGKIKPKEKVVMDAFGGGNVFRAPIREEALKV